MYTRHVLIIAIHAKAKKLNIVHGNTFLQYIQEYQERARRSAIHAFAANLGIDEAEMFELYTMTDRNGIDMLKLDHLEKTADEALIKTHYKASAFKARIQLHQDLKEYIEERKADTVPDEHKP